MTDAPNLIYSQFLRERTFAALWMDFWILIAVAITLAYSLIFIRNPNKYIYPVLAVRAFMDGTIGLYDLEDYGLKVM